MSNNCIQKGSGVNFSDKFGLNDLTYFCVQNGECDMILDSCSEWAVAVVAFSDFCFGTERKKVLRGFVMLIFSNHRFLFQTVIILLVCTKPVLLAVKLGGTQIPQLLALLFCGGALSTYYIQSMFHNNALFEFP